ncbi:MAG: bifunctional (p)ppGpp synthetase/guanosine-3',5'-bis(diphosphate) 3'-pyrophosphohydrolase [Bacteroidales bacterium]|nr:bifunctional (p)ppGpp synthetase/guanosine-3',5'-bis(diphosphate) 3'-pyrophosphohydrolase [Bacteroidales bacterium]MBR5862762.1 bifunctional (p)ppGpp synthetase/guanosine-3',5'-bis(diphosphate) 3'-pyrophosphohydrolase [Bacteroidales bacterium]
MRQYIDELFPRYDQAGRELILKAYEIAAEALKEHKRSNGNPFIEHPVAVARIACDEIGLSAECIAAIFLHEATRFFPETDIMSAKFGQDVYTIVDGLDKIATIKPKDTRLEAENYKKLIVSYSRDPRVTVLKIADRLEVMRSLDMFPKLSRERKILETMMLYIPLAHQLGLYNIKSEMEDIYFRHAEPEQYRTITNKLKSTEKDREKLMTQFIEPLKQKLLDEGIRYKLKVRTKTALSIYKKMKKQKVPFEGVFDVFAIRFIIDCEENKETEHALCWKVFSYVTEEYESDTKRLRDWISNPKPNGYESLHITVKNREGSALEVQIRTKRMDDMAESGLASHWSYKGIRHEETLDKWLTAVRKALESPLGSEADPMAAYYEDEVHELPTQEVFVFTPSGELRKLPSGATVLDFAFDIHSNLGLKCTGGRVNGKAVRINEKLKTGDIVEIMSGKNQKPSPDWLNFVVTNKARTKIKQKLGEGEFAKATDGKELLGRRLKNWKMELDDETTAAIIKKHQFKTINAFYAAIGDGTVDVADVKEWILEHKQGVQPQQAPAEIDKRPKELIQEKGSDDILIIDAKNVKGIDYRMARCCNPVFGDDVFGFVTRTEGIKIHRISCPNAARLMDQYPYRIQKVKWSTNPSSGNFQTGLRISAALEPYVINEIMDIVNSFRASIRMFNVVENDRQGTYEITMKIAVPSSLELDKVTSQIRNLRNVVKITRI